MNTVMSAQRKHTAYPEDMTPGARPDLARAVRP